MLSSRFDAFDGAQTFIDLKLVLGWGAKTSHGSQSTVDSKHTEATHNAGWSQFSY